MTFEGDEVSDFETNILQAYLYQEHSCTRPLPKKYTLSVSPKKISCLHTKNFLVHERVKKNLQ